MLAINAKIYRNTGTNNAPTWSECSLISDAAINPGWDEGNADARESRVHQSVKTMLGLEFPCKMKKKIGDANYEAFMNALLGDAVLDLLILDGDKDTEGVRGWRCDCQIFSGNEDQALANVLYIDLAIKPAYHTNAPKAVKVAAGPTLTYSTPGATGGTFA